jgi:hypothetical protein
VVKVKWNDNTTYSCTFLGSNKSFLYTLESVDSGDEAEKVTITKFHKELVQLMNNGDVNGDVTLSSSLSPLPKQQKSKRVPPVNARNYAKSAAKNLRLSILNEENKLMTTSSRNSKQSKSRKKRKREESQTDENYLDVNSCLAENGSGKKQSLDQSVDSLDQSQNLTLSITSLINSLN